MTPAVFMASEKEANSLHFVKSHERFDAGLQSPSEWFQVFSVIRVF